MILQQHRVGSMLATYCRFRASRNITSTAINFTDSKVSRTDGDNKEPIKFTTSKAYIDYKASYNFRGGDDRNLPDSHNLMLTSTGILGFLYLIFLRDDIEADGGKNLFKPLHETVPEMAIPLIQSAIAENRRLGYDTSKLDKKLAELMREPEKHGISKPKLVEN